MLRNLVYGSITSEDCEELTPHHFKHLIPLAQAGLDYMLFQANSTGAALVCVWWGEGSTDPQLELKCSVLVSLKIKV